MKSTGIVRGIDALGRIDGDAIVLKKYRPKGSCDFCGTVDEQAVQFAGYCICSACRKKIGAL